MPWESAGVLRVGRSKSWRIVILTGLVAASVACVPPSHNVSAPQSSPCDDSLYVRLKGQNPDSLSERSWQRLQSLDRDCAATRAPVPVEAGGMMGMGHGRGGRWTGVGIVAALLMVIMMTALR